MKEEKAVGGSNSGHEVPNLSFVGKDLEAALDSFDNLFCRRCLVIIILNFKYILFSSISLLLRTLLLSVLAGF